MGAAMNGMALHGGMFLVVSDYMGPRQVGDDGESLGLDHYGASAPYTILYEQFGLTPERVVAAAYSSLSKVGATSGSTTGT